MLASLWMSGRVPLGAARDPGSEFSDFSEFSGALGSGCMTFPPTFGHHFFNVILDPLLVPIFCDFGAQRPPKWRPFRGHLVNFLVILRKSANWCFPLGKTLVGEV